MTRAHLLPLVEALTRPRKIDTRTAAGQLLASTRHPSLLAELRDARAANIGPGNGAKAPHERTTLNIGASELFASIERTVRTWAIAAGYRPPPSGWPPLEDVLATWHAATHRNPDTDRYAPTLRSWVGAISDLMDPPFRYPIERPCPDCGAEWTPGDTDYGTDPNRALNVIEREPADASQIVCHACGATWHGVEGARELVRRIDLALPPIGALA